MTIKAFHLENGKSVVTPGLKTHDPDADLEKMDSDADAAAEIHRIISSLKTKPRPASRVRFDPDVKEHDVIAYSHVYGQHPKTFNFDQFGRMIKIEPNNDVYSAEALGLSPNSRRQILEKTLRDGAAWETPTVELIAKITKKKTNKYAKQRLGSKAAKHAERMESGGEDLDEEAATLYRALSARILYLSMDRPEIAFAAKELCRHFAHPTKTGVEALKRVARFLLGQPRLVWHFPFQRCTDVMKVYVCLLYTSDAADE